MSRQFTEKQNFVETKLGKLKIKLTHAAPRAITVPPSTGLFPLSAVIVCVGRRGCGKSTSIASLLHDYHKHGYLDRLWVLSPTCRSSINLKMFQGLPLAPGDCYEDMSYANFESMLQAVEQEGTDWKEYLEELNVYKQILPYMKRGRFEDIPSKLLLQADQYHMFDGHKLEVPKSRYGHSPRMFCMMDDVQHSKLMKQSMNNPVASLAIKNRHCAQGCGLSIIYCVQSYTANGGGIPRYVRENATVYILYRLASQARRVQLSEDLSDSISQEEFLALYDYCTSDDDIHSFFCIDMDSPKAMRYRKQFDTIITPKEITQITLSAEKEDTHVADADARARTRENPAATSNSD